MKVDSSLIHRLFYPQVPAVLSAMVGRRVSAMPVVSYASVSDSPPMVAVSSAPSHYTCKLVVEAGCFSLCILDRTHAGAISRLASVSGAKTEDKLADAGLRYCRGGELKVPVIEDASASLECSLTARRKFGDHLLLVGEVRAARANDAFDGFWDFAKYRPLLYTGWREGLTTLPGA
ncbi:MAG TPA: flavin reductase family protein [Nitrososphaerales archaeon]|nr:flavin reductase family protein [Nitrososphaerales archaeon]